MSFFTITVRGKEHAWLVKVGARQAARMREDGIEVAEVVNTIPV